MLPEACPLYLRLQRGLPRQEGRLLIQTLTQLPLINEKQAHNPKSGSETPGLRWELMPVVSGKTSPLPARRRELQRSPAATQHVPEAQSIAVTFPSHAATPSPPHRAAPPQRHPGTEVLLSLCHPPPRATQLPLRGTQGSWDHQIPASGIAPRLMPATAP